MISPRLKGNAMNDLVITHGITQRRACRLFAFERFVGRYKHKIKNDSEFKDKLLSIVPERRRFGYRRACILLNKERLKINHIRNN